MSLHAADARHTRHRAADLLALDQGTRQLMHSLHVTTFEQLRPAEDEAALRKAWAGFETALTAACGGSSSAVRALAMCAEATAMRSLLEGEIKASGPSGRMLDRAVLSKAMVLLGRFNAASAADAQSVDALVGKLVDDYGWALLVLTLSTVGFVAAGLVLILLVGRASMEHQRQWQAAGDARDLLQETIDSLPAGVVLYDKDERLVMYNKAAVATAPHIAKPGAIGMTYSQMAYDTERDLDAKGVGRIGGAKEWVARFRSKGIRHLRTAPDGRWIEWMEKGTDSGGTVGLRVDVTDLKNKELEVERARAEYQSLVDSLSDMVYALDSKGVFTFASAAAIDLLEVPAAEVVGRRFADFLEAEDLERATVATRVHLRSTDQAVRHINLRLKRADGSIRHMECRYRRPPGDGRAIMAVGVMRDITERVELIGRLEQHMAEIEHARADYQALLDSIGDVVLKVDPHTNRVVFANAAAVERWGLQMVGADAFDHIAGGDRARVSDAARSSLAGRLPRLVQLHYRVVTASGELRHVEANCRKVWDPDGKSLVVAIVRDIEDRVRLERRLADEMGRLRSIVESIGAGVILADRDLKLIVVNREVLNIHGVTEEYLLDRPVADTVGIALDKEVYRQWLAGEQTRPVRYRRSVVDAAGRQRLFDVTASPIIDASGVMRQIVFLGVDDTERHDTERALFAAERLATVGEMAATVAHELSQPLQVIDLACQAARDELTEAAERGRPGNPQFLSAKLERISNQVERAARIVGELRAFVRGTGAGDDPAPFRIADAMRGAVDLTSHGLQQQQASLSVSLPDELPAVLGDVAKLEQVLVNLINNARDAGGRAISVAASAVEREGRSLVRIAVEDSGPGIAPEVLPRLFVGFVTTKARGKGTGLGLRICRRIVEEMGGSISAGNRAEGGARFEILLPAAEPVIATI